MKMDIRYANHPEDAKKYTTEEVRNHFLINSLFVPDEINLTYSHVDRIIAGGIMPVEQAVKLKAGKEMGVDFFLERREMGVINIGGKGIVSLDGTDYELESREGAYIGMGIISDLGGIYFLPRLVGMGKAKLLSFTGDIIDAKYAEQIGLVDQVVPENELKPVVDELARKLANGPSLAIGMYKHTMHKSANMDLDTSLKFVNHLQYLLLNTEDFKEGFKAFLEKRKPVFKGK